MRLSANHKDWWSRVVVWLPRSQADSPYHHCTQGINHHHYHHLTKGGIHAQEVSCIANGCSYTTTAHALAMCSPLPASVAEHMRRTPRSHISSSLTPQRHMSLTDRPSVCFPLQDEVHFLCSLCFRPQIKKRDLPFKMLCLHCVSALRESTKPPHSGWIINLDRVSNRLNL